MPIKVGSMLGRWAACRVAGQLLTFESSLHILTCPNTPSLQALPPSPDGSDPGMLAAAPSAAGVGVPAAALAPALAADVSDAGTDAACAEACDCRVPLAPPTREACLLRVLAICTAMGPATATSSHTNMP